MAGEFIPVECPTCGVAIETFETVAKHQLRGKTHTSPWEPDDWDSVITLAPCGHVFEGDIANALVEQRGMNLIHHDAYQRGVTRND